MTTDDEDFNDEVESVWNEWAQEVGLMEKLIAGRKARIESGEIFFVFITNNKLESPVKLDIKLVESDQVTAEDGLGTSLLNTDNSDGIEYDKAGNPTRYRILDEHPGSDAGAAGIQTKKSKWLKASEVVHMFRVDRPGQPRGVPEISAALPLFAILRRYTLAVLEAAETAANNAYVIQTEHPSLDSASIDFDVAPFDVVDMERNMATVLPAGWRAQQMKAEQPTDSYPDFKGEILNEVARALNVPFNIAAGNSSKYNYASGRLDHQAYFRDLSIERKYQEDTILLATFEKWMAEAVRTQAFESRPAIGVDANTIHRQKEWYWDGHGQIDPIREAKAQEIRLRDNVTSLAIECAKEGKDWREIIKQRGRERRLMEEEGLELPPPLKQMESDDYGANREDYELALALREA
jgi:lambda family phage portal protein